MAETPPAKNIPDVEIKSYWCKLFEGLQVSPMDFYSRVEQAIQLREVPGLEISRVERSEGGLLSAKREYLRLTRERLFFEVCAAPFGTGFFVSSRFGEVRLRVDPLAAVLLLIGLLVLTYVLVKAIGFFWAVTVMFVSVGAAVWFMRIAVSRGLEDVDATLMKTPVIGPLYERFFRKVTYYRIDIMGMYQQAVHNAVTQSMDEISKEKGIPPLSESERKPILKDFYMR